MCQHTDPGMTHKHRDFDPFGLGRYTGHCHNYLKFYQLPNSNLFTHRLLFFSKEATSETYGPGSLSHIICLCDLFLFSFIFRPIKPKIQEYLTEFNFLLFASINLSYFYPVYLPIFGAVARKGLTTPLIHRVASIRYLCAGAVHVMML